MNNLHFTREGGGGGGEGVEIFSGYLQTQTQKSKLFYTRKVRKPFINLVLSDTPVTLTVYNGNQFLDFSQSTDDSFLSYVYYKVVKRIQGHTVIVNSVWKAATFYTSFFLVPLATGPMLNTTVSICAGNSSITQH